MLLPPASLVLKGVRHTRPVTTGVICLLLLLMEFWNQFLSKFSRMFLLKKLLEIPWWFKHMYVRDQRGILDVAVHFCLHSVNWMSNCPHRDVPELTQSLPIWNKHLHFGISQEQECLDLIITEIEWSVHQVHFDILSFVWNCAFLKVKSWKQMNSGKLSGDIHSSEAE